MQKTSNNSQYSCELSLWPWPWTQQSNLFTQRSISWLCTTKQVWSQKDQQFTTYDKNSHVLIIWKLWTWPWRQGPNCFCTTFRMLMMHHHIKFGYKSWAVQKIARTHGQTDTAIPVPPPPPSNKARQEIIGFTSAQHTHISNLTFQTKYRDCQNLAIACCLFLYRVQYWFFLLSFGWTQIWPLFDQCPPRLDPSYIWHLPSVRRDEKMDNIYVYVRSVYTTKRAGGIQNSNMKEKINGTILPIHGWQMFSYSATISAGWVCALSPLNSISNTLFCKDCSLDPVKNLSNN